MLCMYCFIYQFHPIAFAAIRLQPSLVPLGVRLCSPPPNEGLSFGRTVFQPTSRAQRFGESMTRRTEVLLLFCYSSVNLKVMVAMNFAHQAEGEILSFVV